jgi:class 3 adenylate cyclase
VRKTKLSKIGLRRALRQAIARSRYEARYAPPLHAIRPAAASSSGVKVLLVEDDPAARRLLERRLSQMHFTVFSADSVASALSMAPVAAPDVALVDHELPDGTGLDVARAFARLPALLGVPLIMVSANTDQDTVMRALASGIDEYIQKPINVSELALRIHAMLSLSARQRRLSELNARLNREKALLARYISADVLQRALAAASGQGAPGWSGEAVVLVFDLRDSTRIAESMEPRAFSELLSQLLNDLMDLVFSAHGFISKLTGDGFIATFGASAGSDLAQAAGNAVDCAVRIRGYFELVNEMRSQDGEYSLGYGAGVATGRLFTGDVGYERRMEYMALGPALTRASHLEAFTKRVGVSVLVDARTRRLDASGRPYKYCEVRNPGGRSGKVYSPEAVRARPEIQIF